jgi:inner membrane protein
LDPLTQGTLGAALAQSAASKTRVRAFTAAGALAALAPDLDILIRSNTDPLLYLEYHRQFSHSLVFIPLGAALVALLLWPFVKRRLEFRLLYLACVLGYATHGLLDACTSYGTQLFWPFSDARVSWNWISVVDPLFSLPLFALVAIAALRRRPAFAVAGLCWAIFYLGVGIVQHERALAAAGNLAAARGHDPVRLTVKPGFANLMLWKSLYEMDGRIFVDGHRLAVASMGCGGMSIDRLNVARDLPWLEPDSQQAEDLDRFAWYSDEWLALDPEDPGYVVDVRYASLPNRIDALWGLKLDPDADRDAHSVWHVVRSRRSEDLDQLLGLLAGRGCEAQQTSSDG